jgi:threonine/homoserine/homoserine lactone efflux protein
MLEAYLVTLAGVLLGQIAPGPNLLAVAGAALGQGRRAAGFVALGVATAIFAWLRWPPWDWPRCWRSIPHSSPG